MLLTVLIRPSSKNMAKMFLLLRRTSPSRRVLLPPNQSNKLLLRKRSKSKARLRRNLLKRRIPSVECRLRKTMRVMMILVC